MPKTNNPYPEWDGFDAPHYTQVPDDLFDMWLPYLSGSELKVLLYITRRTFGWKKDADAISLGQITKGITRRDGQPLDRGTGLAESTAVLAIQGLEAKGLIVAAHQTAPDGGHAPTIYRLHLRHPSSDNRGRGVIPSSDNRRRDASIIGEAHLRLSEIQETPVQETIQETGGDHSDSRSGNIVPVRPPLYSPVIAGAVLDLGRALGDELAGPGAVQEALALWARSGWSEAHFVAQLQTARGKQRRLSGVLGALAKQVPD